MSKKTDDDMLLEDEQRRALSSLKTARTIVWTLVWGGSVLLAIYVFLANLYSNTEYTFIKPSSAPGTLLSDRWNVDFYFTGATVFLFFLPITAAYMSDAPQHEWRRNMHVIFLIVFFFHSVLALGLWGALYYAKANDATPENSGNAANDKRWCCVYRHLDPIRCTNTAPCPGVGPADLSIDQWFLLKYWGLVSVILFIVLDTAYTLCWFRPTVKRYLGAMLPQTTQDEEQPALQPASVSRPILYLTESSRMPPRAERPKKYRSAPKQPPPPQPSKKSYRAPSGRFMARPTVGGQK